MIHSKKELQHCLRVISMLKAIGIPIIPFYSDTQVNWHWKINSKHEISIINLFGFDRYTLHSDTGRMLPPLE